eukprot:9894346-Heterocapsa_arctica.AAC.1
MLKKVMKDGSEYIHVCYEWPRNHAGWGLDVMKELRQLQPHEVFVRRLLLRPDELRRRTSPKA